MIIDSVGCTPCQCGDVVACQWEKVERFFDFIPFELQSVFLSGFAIILYFLMPALIVKWLIGILFPKSKVWKINIVSAFFASMTLMWSIFQVFSSTIQSAENLWFLYVHVLVVGVIFVLLSWRDLRTNRVKISNFIFGGLVLAGSLCTLVFGVIKYQEYKLKQVSEVQDQQNKLQNELIESLGLNKKAADILELLKNKKYSLLSEFIGQREGVYFYFSNSYNKFVTKDEFQKLSGNNSFSKIILYGRDSVSFTLQDLLSSSSELVSGKYTKSSSVMGGGRSVYFSYISGNKITHFTFKKSVDYNWYLSEFGYFDSNLIKFENQKSNSLNLEWAL